MGEFVKTKHLKFLFFRLFFPQPNCEKHYPLSTPSDRHSFLENSKQKLLMSLLAIWCEKSALTTYTQTAIVHVRCFSCSLDILTELLQCYSVTGHMYFFLNTGFVCLCG